MLGGTQGQSERFGGGTRVPAGNEFCTVRLNIQYYMVVSTRCSTAGVPVAFCNQYIRNSGSIFVHKSEIQLMTDQLISPAKVLHLYALVPSNERQYAFISDSQMGQQPNG